MPRDIFLAGVVLLIVFRSNRVLFTSKTRVPGHLVPKTGARMAVLACYDRYRS